MARKIENQMITAMVKLGKAQQVNSIKVGSNTRVDSDATGAVWVYLHGHNIAFMEDKGTHYQVRFNLCGYNTRTTRSRINAICGAFIHGRNGVCQRRGELCFVTKYGVEVRIDSESWINATDGTYIGN